MVGVAGVEPSSPPAPSVAQAQVPTAAAVIAISSFFICFFPSCLEKSFFQRRDYNTLPVRVTSPLKNIFTPKIFRIEFSILRSHPLFYWVKMSFASFRLPLALYPQAKNLSPFSGTSLISAEQFLPLSRIQGGLHPLILKVLFPIPKSPLPRDNGGAGTPRRAHALK